MVTYSFLRCLVCIKKTWKIYKKVREVVTDGEEGSGLVDRTHRRKQDFSKYTFYIFLIF